MPESGSAPRENGRAERKDWCGRAGLRRALRRIHPVDKSLMLFLLVLLAQSAWNLFFPGSSGQTAGDIDIVVRTSSAAIFGYMLSANFLRHAADGQPPDASPEAPPAAAGGTGTGALARIGFDAAPAPETVSPPELPPQQAGGDVICLQVAVATGIGIFCLVALLAVRNLAARGGGPEPDPAAVVQFRDFVSGCVGFLIGSPTHREGGA